MLRRRNNVSQLALELILALQESDFLRAKVDFFEISNHFVQYVKKFVDDKSLRMKEIESDWVNRAENI